MNSETLIRMAYSAKSGVSRQQVESLVSQYKENKHVPSLVSLSLSVCPPNERVYLREHGDTKKTKE